MIYAPELQVWHKEGKATATKIKENQILAKQKMAYEAEQIVLRFIE